MIKKYFKLYYVYTLASLILASVCCADTNQAYLYNSYLQRVENHFSYYNMGLNSKSTKIQKKSDLQYLGYYNKNTIWLNSNLNEFELELTLIHEYTHAYRHQYNAQEKLWLDEGLAKLTEYLYSKKIWPKTYGISLQNNAGFRIHNTMADYRLNGPGYQSSFWFVFYLYQHFGGDILYKKLLESPKSGWNSILKALEELHNESIISVPFAITKANILRHFGLSLWMNDTSVAQQNLFFIHDAFTPLKNYAKIALSSDFLKSLSQSLDSTETVIFYSKRYLSPADLKTLGFPITQFKDDFQATFNKKFSNTSKNQFVMEAWSVSKNSNIQMASKAITKNIESDIFIYVGYWD